MHQCDWFFKIPSVLPVFVDLLRIPGIDSQPGGPVRQPYCRAGPPGYIGRRNRFLGIDFWASLTFTNTGSGRRLSRRKYGANNRILREHECWAHEKNIYVE
jgi:hypothetical protein